MNTLERIKNAIWRWAVEKRSKFSFHETSWRFNRQNSIIRKVYKWKAKKVATTNRVVVYMTPDTEFSGLADRLRTLISAQFLAEENGRSLAIYHSADFKLEEYLEPNEINWLIKPEDINFGLNHVAFLWYCQEIPELKYKNKEYHMYASANLLERLPTEELQQKYPISKVFWRMFKLSPHTQKIFNDAFSSMNLEEGKYIVCHLRFCNFFELVERSEGTKRTITPEEKARMIDDVHYTITKIHEEEGNVPIVLFSDSNTMLNAPHPDFVRTVPGEVGHIRSKKATHATMDKAFIDMLIMSKAAKIYSIRSKDIYGGNYSRFAARIGNIPFKKYDLLSERTDNQ